MATGPKIDIAPHDGPLSDESDKRKARRSRAASIGLVLVLFAVSMFAVWSSWATGDLAKRTIAASNLSEDYVRAAAAVAAYETLADRYRVSPDPAVRVRYDEAAASLESALAAAVRDGDESDRALVGLVRAENRHYQAATAQLFSAVDRGDTAGAQRIEDTEMERSFKAVESLVLEAADDKHGMALADLAELQRVEKRAERLTPLVFLVGLLLAAVLASISDGYRRSLDVQRARAVQDSLHDALTGLPNRTLLADRFGQALRTSNRAGTSTGLLLIDLDRFKEINDTFGHHYGDVLLTLVGPRLSNALRDVDTVARLGGDEFAVLLPDLNTVADAIAVANKLRSTLEAPFHVEGVELDVEASIGVVLSGEHGQDAAILLQRADIAMYVAKTQSIGVFAYDPTVDGHSPAKLALLGDLRRALERDELVLHYQPKIGISTREVIGVEALVRWQHPESGLIFPDTFIPLAEHTGLIGPLTRHILGIALAQARAWADAGRPLTISVNLSARNLLDEQLPDQVAELLAAHGVPADFLELEVTESAIMTEPVRAQQVLEQLSALGVRLSIDDFGIGYTSLGKLKTLPVNELKIDRSFVMTMAEDRSNALIVQSVVDLGHNLGLTIVAEGVEDGNTLSALAGFGCDVAQGYHLSRPIDADAFDRWYAEHRQLHPQPSTETPTDAQITRQEQRLSRTFQR